MQITTGRSRNSEGMYAEKFLKGGALSVDKLSFWLYTDILAAKSLERHTYVSAYSPLPKVIDPVPSSLHRPTMS